MSKITDIRPVAAKLFFLPVQFRVPLKFGTEVTTSVTCARVCLTVEDRSGRRAEGWGETPLAVQWGWPSDLSYSIRHERMQEFCRLLTAVWPTIRTPGHPMEVGDDFLHNQLPQLLNDFAPVDSEPMPHLAALICTSAFDVALHDALGVRCGCDTYQTYGRELLNRDLASFFASSGRTDLDFKGRYPAEFLVAAPPRRLQAWHLVGGLDPLDPSERTGDEPNDGYPVTLIDWIEQDGLTCLKVKLRGNDAAWDYARLVRVGGIAASRGIKILSADFNCTVTDPAYVNEILDRLHRDAPEVFENIRYIEQPFPYDLDAHPIDVHSVARRKPLLLDESATIGGRSNRGACSVGRAWP